MKPFRLLSNTAVTEIEMRTASPLPHGTQSGAAIPIEPPTALESKETPPKQILIKVNKIEVEDRTKDVVQKLRRINGLYDDKIRLQKIQNQLQMIKKDLH